MEFNRFEEVLGTCVEDIPGQFKTGYSISDLADFYDLAELSKWGGHQGSTISFYDYDTGKIYKPFEKKRNVLYGKPVYLKNYFWFLQADYNSGKITLFKYLPDEIPQMITHLNIEDVNLYNLRIIGQDDIYIVSDDEEFACYYPKSFKFHINSNESAVFIADEKVYLSEWTEEGWDDENDCETED